jgi:sortase A
MAVMLGIAAGIVFFLTNNLPEMGSVLVPLPTPTVSALGLTPTGGINPLSTPLSPLGEALAATVDAPRPTLFIPASGVYAPIIPVVLRADGWDIRSLEDNVGHLDGTARPGEPGNSGLVGHVERADGRPGVFAALKSVHAGDPLVLIMGGRERVFTITSVITTTPDDLTPLYPTDEERLTLITCDKYDFVNGTYLERVVAVAVPV